MRASRRLAIGAAVTATFVIGIAAVWLTGDTRAFGMVVTLAGVAAGTYPVRHQVRDVIVSLYTDPHSRRPV